MFALRARSYRSALAATLLSAGISSLAQADDEVDAQHAVPILLRVLTYDRAFKGRGSGDFTLAVITDAAHAAERTRVLEICRGLHLETIQGRPLRFEGAEAADAASLSAAQARTGAGALLIPAGAPPALQAALAGIGTYTLSLDVRLVEHKQALVGIGSHDGRPQIVINVDAARALGASFDNAILRLARLIQ